TITVNVAGLSKFGITASPTTTTAGTPISITVTAQDPYGNTITNYSGTVHFTSSTDGQATLPANYNFSPGERGVHTFTNAVTLKTAGSQTITATDTVSSAITGTSGNITVSPAAATTLAVVASTGAATAASPITV